MLSRQLAGRGPHSLPDRELSTGVLQAEEDAAAGRNVVPIPADDAGRDSVIAAAVANCEAQMAEDRKTTALKALQVPGVGHFVGSGVGQGGVLPQRPALWGWGVAAGCWSCGRPRRCTTCRTGQAASLQRLGGVCHAAAQARLCTHTHAQGHIWRAGFLGGELHGELYRDVPDALAAWRGLGIKTYIYSSGSR